MFEAGIKALLFMLLESVRLVFNREPTANLWLLGWGKECVVRSRMKP